MARPTYGQPHGVRLNPRQDERCRSAIKTTMLLQRLNGFALEEHDPQTGKPIQMSGDQIKAALGLLRKTMADLAVTQHVGPDGGPVLIVTGVERGSAPDPARNDETTTDTDTRGFTD